MPTYDFLAEYQWLEQEFAVLISNFKYSSEINLRLERMTHLLELLDNPHTRYRSIHVGGTSGKGSTATMIAAGLTAAGYRTGLHTSPHLQVMNERHQIDGRYTTTRRLAELWRKIRPAIAEVTHTSPFGSPSYFEAQVALSFCLFAEEGVDAAVVEVGVGGSLDATNVLPATVAVLTNVGLDHTDILGDTVTKIGRDKSGIIKAGQLAISGCSQPSVKGVITRRAKQVGATVWQLGRDFHYDITAEGHGRFRLPGAFYDEVAVGLPGDFQVQNGAVAAAALRAFERVTGWPVPEAAVRHGLTQAHIAGRVEIVQERPLVILDGAHNADKMRAVTHLMAQTKRPHGRVITVLGVKAGKATAEMLPMVAEISDEMVVTRFIEKGLWKPIPPAKLGQELAQLRPNMPIHVVDEPLAAVAKAIQLARPEDTILVTGSLYLVGDARAHWFPPLQLLAEIEGMGA